MRTRVALLLFALFVIAGQSPLESIRWWQSSRVISAIKLTPAQVALIERAYASTLSDRCRLTEKLTAAMAHVGHLNDLDDPSEDDLLAGTDRLGEVAAEESRVETAVEWGAVGMLSAEQRQSLIALRRRRLP